MAENNQFPVYPGETLQSINAVNTNALPRNIQPVTQPDNISNVDKFRMNFKDPYAMAEVTANPIGVPLVPTLRYTSDALGYDYRDVNLEYKYGDKYPVLSFFNNMGKFGVSWLGAFAQGMATIPFAIKAINEGDPEIFFNNEMTNTISKWQEELETSMPSFKTEYQDNHPFLSAFNPLEFSAFTGTWGEVIKNIGFTAGSISAALVQDWAVTTMTGGAGTAPLIGLQLAKLGRWANSLGKGVAAFSEAGQNIKLARNAVNIANNLKTFGSRLGYGTKLLTSSIAEGSIEANQTYNNLRKQLREDFIQKYGFEPTGQYLNEIESMSVQGGNANLLANTALLTLTNAITFDGLLKGKHFTRLANEKSIAEKTAIQRTNIDTFALKTKADPFKSFAERFGYYGYKVGSKLVTPMSEAFEEGSQFASDAIIEGYIRRKYDDVNNFYTDKLYQSMAQGMKETFLTKEGQNNMILGFLSGGLIKAANFGIDKIRGTNVNKSTHTQAVLSLLNKNTVTGLFKHTYHETAAAVGIMRDMKKANETGDLFTFKNLQRENFFNFILSGVKTNRLDLRIEQLKELKNLNEDQFEELTGGEFTAENKAEFDRYVDNLISEADSIKNSIKKVNNVFVNPYDSKTQPKEYSIYEDYKDALSYNLSLVEDSLNRHKKLGDEVTTQLPGLDINKAVNLVNYKGIRQTVSEFKQKLADLKEAKKNLDPTSELYQTINKEIAFLESKIPVLSTTLSYIEARTLTQAAPNENFLVRPENIEQYTKHVADILEYYSGEKIPDYIIKKQLLRKLEDIFKLDKQGREATKYYEILRTKKGYNRFRDKLASMLQPYSSRIEIDEDGNFKYKTDEEIAAEKEALAKAAAKMLEEMSKQKAANLPEEPATPEEKETIETIVAKEATGQDLTEEEEELKAAKPNIYTNKKKSRASADKAVDEMLADLNIVDPEKDLKAYEDDEEESDEPAATPRKTKTVSKSNDKFEGVNPYSLLGKIFGEDKEFGSGDMIAIRNVFNLIFKTPYNEAVKKLSTNVRFVVKESSAGLSPDSYTPIFHRDSKGKNTKVKAYEHLLRKGYPIEIEVYNGDQFLGLLTLGNSLYYKTAKGEVIPVSQIDKAEYERATRRNDAAGNKVKSNNISTYDEFIKIAKAYETASNQIQAQFENGKKEFSSEEIGQFFSGINLWQGVSDRQNEASEDGNTIVSDLEYLPEDAVILEVPYSDDKRDNFTKYRFISKDGIMEEVPDELASFVSENISTISSIDQRFVLLIKTPQGTYYPNFSIIALRHSALEDADLEEAFKSLKNDSRTKANNNLDNLYINISSGVGNEKGIRLVIKKHRDYTATIYINDKNAKSRTVIGITEKQLKSLNTIEDLIDYINDSTEAFDPYETKLQLSDIKAKNIKWEQVEDFDYLTKTLIAPVPATVAKDFYINFIPRTDTVPAAQPPTTPPVTPPAAPPAAPVTPVAPAPVSASAQLSLEQQIINLAIRNKDVTGITADQAKEAVKTKENADAFLRSISEQVNNSVGDPAVNLQQAEKTYGKMLVKEALSKYPKPIPVAETPINTDELIPKLYALGWEKKDIDDMSPSAMLEFVNKQLRKKVDGIFGIVDKIRIFAEQLANAKTEEEKNDISIELAALQEQLKATEEGRLAIMIERDFENLVSELEENNKLEKDCK